VRIAQPCTQAATGVAQFSSIDADPAGFNPGIGGVAAAPT
jgi:hypothetical protein